MSLKFVATLLLALASSGRDAAAQAPGAGRPTSEAPRPGEHGVVNFLLPIEPDAVLQHSKETYVLYGCAYCHGVDLRVRNGEAADLLHSGLVGADTGGNLIGAILKNGIPQTAKLSPMPQYSDLSETEMRDISRWIHVARMRGRSEEVMKDGELPQGVAATGKSLYEGSCSSCHSSQDMTAILKRIKPADLKAALLKPAILTAVVSYKVGVYNDSRRLSARAAHSMFTENSGPQAVSDLLAYLKTLK